MKIFFFTKFEYRFKLIYPQVLFFLCEVPMGGYYLIVEKKNMRKDSKVER